MSELQHLYSLLTHLKQRSVTEGESGSVKMLPTARSPLSLVRGAWCTHWGLKHGGHHLLDTLTDLSLLLLAFSLPLYMLHPLFGSPHIDRASCVSFHAASQPFCLPCQFRVFSCLVSLTCQRWKALFRQWKSLPFFVHEKKMRTPIFCSVPWPNCQSALSSLWSVQKLLLATIRPSPGRLDR